MPNVAAGCLRDLLGIATLTPTYALAFIPQACLQERTGCAPTSDGEALPLSFHPAQEFLHDPQVQLVAQMRVFHAGIDRWVIVDFDHHRLVADLFQIDAV